MTQANEFVRKGMARHQQPGIRVLVESALRSVVESRSDRPPGNRDEWVRELTGALMAESDTLYQKVIAGLFATGVGNDEIFERYVPDAARLLGEYWVQDRASFVEVTVGAGRLQQLLRERGDSNRGAAPDRTIPLGQSVLLAVPDFENHSLGAFIAADQFRRHGIWVHMAIGLSAHDLAVQATARRYTMIGLTAGSVQTLDKIADYVRVLRAEANPQVPLVLGGYVVALAPDAGQRTGVDHAVATVREAIERCRLSTVAESLSLGAP